MNKRRTTLICIASIAILCSNVYNFKADTEYQMLTRNYSEEVNGMKYIVIDEEPTKNLPTLYKTMSEDESLFSTHYIISGNDSIYLVSDNQQSYHIGVNNKYSTVNNSNSIGVLMCKPAEGETYEQQMTKLEDEVKSLMVRHNIPVKNVLLQREIDAIQDSNDYLTDERWKDFKARLGGVYEDSTEVIDKKGEITLDRVLLKSDYSAASESIIPLDLGQKVSLTEKCINGWYKVEFKDYVGYIYKDFIKIIDDAEEIEEEEKVEEDKSKEDEDVEIPNAEEETDVRDYTVVKETPVYSEPSEDAEKVKPLLKGSIINAETYEEGWIKIKEGFIKKDSVKEVDIKTTKDTVLREGKGIEHAMICTIKSGKTIHLIAMEDDWAKVRFGEEEGWVILNQLDNIPKAIDGQVKADVPLRKTNKVDDNIIYYITKGTYVKIEDNVGAWIKIKIAGREGWIPSFYI